MRAAAFLGLVLTTAAPAVAQRVVTSPGPNRIALTVYRSPEGRGAMDLRYLGGFALVTETRRVPLPRGPAVVRFEGVAEGIVPVSAVIDGLPGGVIEKNRDARLLSPASLVDGTLGRQVTLTRTNRATGVVTREQATIVAGPQPGIVLRTTAGIEALRCAGLPEGLSFGGVPAGLSAKPVLGVATTSSVARTVTVRLSYLTSGFDWRASYVATVAPDGRTLDLFAWLTLANSNPEAFVGAETNAVAGRLNRVALAQVRVAAGGLSLACYPLGTTTSDLREKTVEPANDIVVTASRSFALMAPAPIVAAPAPPPPPPEDLGDLKLYRVPARTDVRPRGQKQVALLARAAVPFERRYRRAVYPGQALAPAPTAIVLVLRNVRTAGLGLALPAGSTALYAATMAGDRRLVGQGALTDRAEGETFRLAAGSSTQVIVEQVARPQGATLRVSNANRFPATVDVQIGAPGQQIATEGGALTVVDGIATWTVTVPPGAKAELDYRY